MLDNGDFELVSDGKPAYWEKFGGTMFADGSAARGSYAGCLESDTSSTKWLYQVVAVQGGSWYSASASGRLSGGGGVSIRISWYASSDGSGSQLDQAESNVSSGSTWVALATGPARAPAEANSARVRLVIRPEGPATGCWDDAVFVPSEAPAATPVPSAASGAPTGTLAPNSTPARTPTTAIGRAAPTNASGTPVPLAVFPPGGAGALRLSEVMSDPDPTGRDAAFEWVEIVNVSAETVDLAGWKLGDTAEDQVLPSLQVPPLGYVVVAGASADLPAGTPLVRAPGGQIGNGLGNDGDYLKLTAPNGETGDEISYGDNTRVFDPAPDAAGRGATIGLIDPLAEPASENWATTQKPTPGEANAFPPRKSATATNSAGVSGAPVVAGVVGSDGRSSVEEAGGKSPVAWVVLGALAMLSGGVFWSRFGPPLQARLKRVTRRLMP